MKSNKILIIITSILLVIAGIMGILLLNKDKRKINIGTLDSKKVSTKVEEKINYTGELRVYNAAEYMDMSTIKDFEKQYKIKVVYKEFESNESMYTDVAKNLNNYDILIPSDYMIDRLIKENKLEKINKSNIPNFANIAEEYLHPEYDQQNEYMVPYMTGTLGILYNKKMVTEPVNSWDILWDSKYKGQIWLWDSQRDVLGMALKHLGYSMNSNVDSQLQEAKNALITQSKLLRGYAEEEARDAMIADEGALALVYAGEAKFAIDQNPNLAYVIPKEGSNKFVDGFVIVKNAKNKENAEKFINFMCGSNIAVRNMTSTGYTSPIKGAWSEFGNNKIMFPTDEELSRCEAFLYDSVGTEKYNKIWREVR